MTQKVEFEVELAMAIGAVALSIGMVALSIGMVEFMVEFATNGSELLNQPTFQMLKMNYSRLETNELSNKRVHADNIGDVGPVDVVAGKIRATSRRKVGGGRIQ